jgi:uncharacterized phage infection (PIP) family protein YhgE
MRITPSQLRRLINEEVRQAQIEEGIFDSLKGYFSGEKASAAPKTVGHKGTVQKLQDAVEKLKKANDDFSKAVNMQLRNLKTQLDAVLGMLDASEDKYSADPNAKRLIMGFKSRFIFLQEAIDETLTSEGGASSVGDILAELNDMSGDLEELKAGLQESRRRRMK